jgi:hypothetical protein
MLGQNPQRKFDEIVTQLRTDDPYFIAKVERLARPGKRRWALTVLLVVALAALAVPVVALAGGAGFLAIVVVCLTGAWLLTPHTRSG